ncbi:MAG: histidine phosphotransferase [Hyphomicrobiales bacterium]|nr:histidine phosphotransferase [Hyphomicrobiales bacterium]
MPVVSLDSLDLAALLCSRVCHDVISPVGAIVNGLELLDEEKDPEMREEALGLIKRSAATASAKLQFCRLAFGAAGSAGASIDTGDAEQVARNLLEDGRTKIEWNAARLLLPKNKVKLLLNMCLIAAAAIPRGGKIAVSITGEDDKTALKVTVTSEKAVRVAHGVQPLLRGEAEEGGIDAHGIQAYFTGLVARTCNMDIGIEGGQEGIFINALPAAAADDVQADQSAA